jgi:hypothetical protein
MLTRDERDYLLWLAQTAPAGRIVELGCFLGCSTAALLTGLAERDHALGVVDPRASVTTYDSFIMPHGGGGRWAPDVREGEWFADLFEANVAPYASAGGQRRLHVRHGWLPDDGAAGRGHELYPEQAPIDVLFVDIAKVWGVHNTVLNTFAPLVPVGGVLVQQDFKSWLPWLFLHMWQLRGQFEPAHDVPGGTVGFVRRDAGSPEPLWTSATFPGARFDEIWDAVEASWTGFGSGQVSLHAAMARGRHAITLGRHDHGVACFEGAGRAHAAFIMRPELALFRSALDGIWADGLATMLRALVKAGAANALIERASRIA